MSTARIIITREESIREIEVDRDSFLIGRNPDCGIVLESPDVSRRHARLQRDPFGRWIVEDVGSTHGTWVAGERIKSHILLPGEKFSAGPFELEVRSQVAGFQDTGARHQVGDDVAPVAVESPAERPLNASRLGEFNRFLDSLGEVTDSASLHVRACQALSGYLRAPVLVLRVMARAGRVDDQVSVLAHEGEVSHLSRRVLEEVLSIGRPVMAGTGQAGDLSLTIMDTKHPRTVCCAPLGEIEGGYDVLYVEAESSDGPQDLLDFVRGAARQMLLMQRSLQGAEARAERSHIEQQLTLARQIQSRLVPSQMPIASGLELAGLYRPALWVGGDYMDAWLVPGGRVALAVADVSGKGLPAALVMAGLQASLRSALGFCGDLAQAVGHVNSLLMEHLPEEMFITLIAGIYTPATGELEWVNAGHPQPLVIGPGTEPRLIGTPCNPPVGVSRCEFSRERSPLRPGEYLVVVSDGITEAQSPDSQLFGEVGLARVLRDSWALGAKGMLGAVDRQMTDFAGGLAQGDDQSLLILRRLA